MRKNAFLWSGAVIYLCLILLIFSFSQYGMVSIFSRSADTRATADRLYKVSYNLLFDLNLYLSREIGRVSNEICGRGGDPRDLEVGLDVNPWLRLVDSWLTEEGISSIVSIRELRLYSYHNGDSRDLVQLYQLGFPREYRYYKGAINIDVVLSISLTDTQAGVSRDTEFRIRSLCPIRFFLLYDLSHSFVVNVAERAGAWMKGRDARDLAESISRGIVGCAEDFLWRLRSELFQGRVEYHIWTERLGGSLFEVSIVLCLIELTDMGEFSFVVYDSSYHRVSYRLRDIRMGFRCRLDVLSEGSNTWECWGTISS